MLMCVCVRECVAFFLPPFYFFFKKGRGETAFCQARCWQETEKTPAVGEWERETGREGGTEGKRGGRSGRKREREKRK